MTKLILFDETMNANVMSILMLVGFIALMYFLLIRPQRKREKEAQAMRDSLKVGDEIVTIGGIVGKVVKTKEDSFVIQVGADKTKFEMKKWAVSSVTQEGKGSASPASDKEEKEDTQKTPRRLLKKDKKAVEEPVEEVVEEIKEAEVKAEDAE